MAELTEKEQEQHHRAINRMIAKLYERYSEADYFIVPQSMNILDASVSEIWYESGVVRRLQLGGLKFDLSIPYWEGLRLTISHREADIFGIWVSASPRGQQYTCIANDTPFKRLDAHIFEIAQALKEQPERERKIWAENEIRIQMLEATALSKTSQRTFRTSDI